MMRALMQGFWAGLIMHGFFSVGSAPGSNHNVLTEGGDNVLLESGDAVLLETA